jgi:uncharacterized protein (TIGR02611 family)
MHARRGTRLLWRTGVFVLGWGIVLAGVVMLVIPGPGWAAIFVGLAVLSTEYAWAHRLLTRARDYARRLADKALDPRVRRRNQAIVAVVLLLTVAAGVWYYLEWGLTLDGLRALFG